MSIATVVTRGYGSFGNISKVVTRGYTVGDAVVVNGYFEHVATYKDRRFKAKYKSRIFDAK